MIQPGLTYATSHVLLVYKEVRESNPKEIKLDVHRYTPQGKLDKTLNISSAAADRIFNAHLPMVRTPFQKYYRVTVVDPDRGTELCPYIVRDTYREDATLRTSPSRDYYREYGVPARTPLIDWGIL